MYTLIKCIGPASRNHQRGVVTYWASWSEDVVCPAEQTTDGFPAGLVYGLDLL